MKKLYLITAKDYDYEEYDSVLIRADTIEEAEVFLKELINNFWIESEDGKLKNFKDYTFEEIEQDGESGVIMASFNAG